MKRETTIRKLCESAVEEHKDKLVEIKLADPSKLDEEFDGCFGGDSPPTAFTAVGEKFIYVPVEYDMATFMVAAPLDFHPMKRQ